MPNFKRIYRAKHQLRKAEWLDQSPYLDQIIMRSYRLVRVVKQVTGRDHRW